MKRALTRTRVVGVFAATALVAAAITIPSSAVLAPSTFDAQNGAFFADEGQYADGTPPAGGSYTDWEDLTPDDDGNLDAGEYIFQNDEPPGQNDDSFTQGTWENTEPPVPSTGSVPPNKSDLTRFYIGVERAGPADKPYLYLGWTRVQEPNGTTNMDFEFNQSDQLSANGVTPVRTHGDVLIEYKLAKGGDTPEIYAYKWNDGVEDPDTDFPGCEGSASFPCWSERSELTSTGGAEGSVNLVTVTELVDDTDLDPYTFGEAAIDLVASGLFTPGECTTFGSAYLKSRSSDSFTAALKDYIAPKEINLSNCGQFTVVKQTENDAEGSFDFTVSPAAGTANANGTGGAVDGGTLADGESFTAYNVQVGNYDITESIPDGWNLDSVVCTQGSNGGSTEVGDDIDAEGVLVGKTISIVPSSNVTCTFTNSQERGSIQIEKVVEGTTDRLGGASFALDEDGDPDTTDDQTEIPGVSEESGLFCIDDLLFGDYNVVETAAPSGYRLVDEVKTVSVSTESACATRAADSVDATFGNVATPSIVTVASGPVTVGENITDTATLSGGYNPTGSITFTAYSDDACTNEVFSDTVSVDSGNGDYQSGAYTTTSAGTIYWIASYSGDDSNDPVSGSCGDENESSAVNKQQPSIVTVASGPVTVGENITDTATLSGGYNPTGNITFTAYSDDACTNEVFSDTVNVDSGNGDYQSGAYTTTSAGTIYWIASYSGDSNNNSVSGSCGDANESSVVNKASPGISTTPMLLPNDSATLSGGFGTLTGSISFSLYDNATCEGDAIYEEGPITVDGFGPYETSNDSVFITADGTYSWYVEYSGDENNEGAISYCDAEQQMVDFTPLQEVPAAASLS